ncbi:type II toxin-antitoxin system RelE family toxin [Halochromatium glycolicum]|uniref:type II toxin-antitoxin system RelE family toxin n=1 Tax=Halochromatium glycolicum TaxID=85075 RepID=UPI001F5B59F5|nr:hypothetical protein [Halochromatium glycolicum]
MTTSPMRIEVPRSAIKDLQQIGSPQEQRLHETIGRLVDFPDVPSLKRLTSFEPAYRLRVGDYRVKMTEIEFKRLMFDVRDLEGKANASETQGLSRNLGCQLSHCLA